MSRSSGLADDSRVRMHVQDISHRFAEVIEANLYDRNAEPAEQARDISCTCMRTRELSARPEDLDIFRS